MRVSRRGFREAVAVGLAFATWPMIYAIGHRAGYAAKLPELWAIAKPTRLPNKTVAGASYDWYDINKPADVLRMEAEKARLKAAGIEFYVARGRVENHTSVDPDPWRAADRRPPLNP